MRRMIAYEYSEAEKDPFVSSRKKRRVSHTYVCMGERGNRLRQHKA